jgi:hypothetical protein
MFTLIHLIFACLQAGGMHSRSDDFYMLGARSKGYIRTIQGDTTKNPVNLNLMAIGDKTVLSKIGLKVRYKWGENRFMFSVSGGNGDRQRMYNQLLDFEKRSSDSLPMLDSLVIPVSEAAIKRDTAIDWKTTLEPRLIFYNKKSSEEFPFRMTVKYQAHNNGSTTIGQFPAVFFSRNQFDSLIANTGDSVMDTERRTYQSEDKIEKRRRAELLEDRINRISRYYCTSIWDLCEHSRCSDNFVLNQVSGGYLYFVDQGEYTADGSITAIPIRDWHAKIVDGMSLSEGIRFMVYDHTQMSENLQGFDLEINHYQVLDKYIIDVEPFPKKRRPKCVQTNPNAIPKGL